MCNFYFFRVNTSNKGPAPAKIIDLVKKLFKINPAFVIDKGIGN